MACNHGGCPRDTWAASNLVIGATVRKEGKWLKPNIKSLDGRYFSQQQEDNAFKVQQFVHLGKTMNEECARYMLPNAAIGKSEDRREDKLTVETSVKKAYHTIMENSPFNLIPVRVTTEGGISIKFGSRILCFCRGSQRDPFCGPDPTFHGNTNEVTS